MWHDGGPRLGLGFADVAAASRHASAAGKLGSAQGPR